MRAQYDFGRAVPTSYLIANSRLRKRMDLAKEIARLHVVLSQVDELASGAVLRWNRSITEPRRLELIHRSCKKALQRLYLKYGV